MTQNAGEMTKPWLCIAREAIWRDVGSYTHMRLIIGVFGRYLSIQIPSALRGWFMRGFGCYQ